MKIYAIGDLHLSFSAEVTPGKWEDVEEYKSMNIFGDHWDTHYYKIYKNWIDTIKDNDLVLIPGDISWAKNIKEAKYDFDFISRMPGCKIFSRGNHDYWWQGIKSLRNNTPDDFLFVQNDSYEFEGISIAGSRGWLVPGGKEFTDHDEKLFKRELKRMQFSLETASDDRDILIIMMHYMPVNENHEKNEFIELFQEHGVDLCVYGHLHGSEAHRKALTGKKWGIKFKLVSADFLDFNPELIINNQKIII